MITRRRRSEAAPAAEPEVQAQPSRLRRFRPQPTQKAAAPVDKRDYYGESIKALQSVAKLQEQIDKLTQQRESHERHIDFLMGEGKLEHIDDGVWQADRKAKMSPSSTDIDLAKFRKYIGEEKFATVISVKVTEAKAMVAEKEYVKAGITTTAGKLGDPKTAISRKKKK
jgi:hypothetical protein